jgi:hypothetical protein
MATVDLTAALRKRFADLQAEIVEIVRRVLTREVSELKGRAIELFVLIDKLDKTVASGKLGARKDIEALLPKEYAGAVREARRQLLLLGAGKRAMMAGPELATDTMAVQAARMIGKLGAAMTKAGEMGREALEHVYTPGMREKLNSALFRFVTGTELPPDIKYDRAGILVGRQTGTDALSRDLFKMLNETAEFKGPVADAVSGKLVEINGRKWNMSSYCDMVAQAHVSELEGTARINTYLEAGVTMIQVDDHGSVDCPGRDLEGTIWSYGQSSKHRHISECPLGPPPFVAANPRCSHKALPYFEGDPIDKVAPYEETLELQAARVKLDQYMARDASARQFRVAYEEGVQGLLSQPFEERGSR